jgi:hypothetical protein
MTSGIHLRSPSPDWSVSKVLGPSIDWLIKCQQSRQLIFVTKDGLKAAENSFDFDLMNSF